jgi:hypothetical protein
MPNPLVSGSSSWQNLQAGPEKGAGYCFFRLNSNFFALNSQKPVNLLYH